MMKQESIMTMWEKLFLYEAVLIQKYGMEDYKEKVVFVITQKPAENCKRCFGRGYTGRYIAVDRVTPCGCVKGFRLQEVDTLEKDSIAMDFDGNVYVAEGERDGS